MEEFESLVLMDLAREYGKFFRFLAGKCLKLSLFRGLNSCWENYQIVYTLTLLD